MTGNVSQARIFILMKKLLLVCLLLFGAALPSFAQEQPTSAKPQPTIDVKAYVAANANPPSSSTGKKETVTVTLKFLVDEQGDLSEVRIFKSSENELLDEEAIRVVESMPQWKPAISKGQPVKMYYTLPLKFVLQPEIENDREDRMAGEKEKKQEEKEERQDRSRQGKEKKEEEKDEE